MSASLTLTGSALLVFAQSPTADSFNPGANGTVQSIAVQPDGRVLLGGYFTSLGGQPRYRIARLHPDGSVDPGFNPRASSTVFGLIPAGSVLDTNVIWDTFTTVSSLAVQPDGKILLGGNFTWLTGQSRRHIGRLNPDGTLDADFRPWPNSRVNCLSLQPDGQILMGGNFTNLNSQSRSRLARLETDGTLVDSFAPEANNEVLSLALQTDGKILVGGNFTTLNGTERRYLGRLNADGSVDTSFNPGADSTVHCLAVQADGKILVGGAFTALGGQSRSRIARLNADGSLDESFDPGANNVVQTLAVQTDGMILAGGAFTLLGGQSRTNIGRLNPDGTVDATFYPAANGAVHSLTVQADGSILAGGTFTLLGGESRKHIGRISNPEPAVQSLTLESGTLTWLRGGSGPEAWQTAFDAWDGSAWTNLGEGVRITGGWRLDGVSLPNNATVRARGHVTGGQYNGSSWFVEDGGGPLLVTTQPANCTNLALTTARFFASAVGASPMMYRWHKDDMPVFDGGKVSGSGTPLLALTGVLGADAGGYSVVISRRLGRRRCTFNGAKRACP